MAQDPLLASIVDFSRLSSGVRAAHLPPLEAQGLFEIESRSIARLWGLPRSGRAVPITVAVTQEGDEQIWRRQFGKESMETRQRVRDGLLIESNGLGRIAMSVTEEGGSLCYRTLRAWFGPIPTPWFPAVNALVSDAEDGWSVSVEVRFPPFGVICRYSGILRPL